MSRDYSACSPMCYSFLREKNNNNIKSCFNLLSEENSPVLNVQYNFVRRGLFVTLQENFHKMRSYRIFLLFSHPRTNVVNRKTQSALCGTEAGRYDALGLPVEMLSCITTADGPSSVDAVTNEWAFIRILFWALSITQRF